MELKKGIAIAVLLVSLLAALVLIGTGPNSRSGLKFNLLKEKFVCAWCTQTVYERPHTMDIMNEKVKLCSDCYEDIQEFRDSLPD